MMTDAPSRTYPVTSGLLARAENCAKFDFDTVEMIECKWELWDEILEALHGSDGGGESRPAPIGPQASASRRSKELIGEAGVAPGPSEATCYVERSKVREVLIGQPDESLYITEEILREVDALPIVTVEGILHHAQPKPDREGARLSNWLADYSHDLMEDGNCDQEAAEVAKAAQWIADALSPVPSTSRSAQQPKVSDLESVYSALAQAQDCIGGETPEDISDEEAREDTLNKVREAMRVIEAMTTPSDGAIYAAASRHMGREWAEDLDKIIDRVSSLPSTACAIPETGDYEGTEDDLIASSVSSTDRAGGGA